MSSSAARPAAAKARAPDYASVAQLRALYRSGEASPVEVVEDLFARIDRYEAGLHCFVTQTRELALALARDAERRWRDGSAAALTGIPYGLKDVINTAGEIGRAHV